MIRKENIYSPSCPNVSKTQVKKIIPCFHRNEEMWAIALDRQNLPDLSSELRPQVDK